MTFTLWSSQTVVIIFLYPILLGVSLQDSLDGAVFIQLLLYAVYRQGAQGGDYQLASKRITMGERIAGVSVPTIVIQLVVMLSDILNGRTDIIIPGCIVIFFSWFLYSEGTRLINNYKLFIPLYKKPGEK